ncbi:lipopolysaccharide assembly protein LapB [Dysgonomonas sp. Marseille-P4361]|uniref:tetratricopeptide repeat protein n=1 Tax=Dysgonomonas sp. Marseille-P4361 TaxID=2161820 RepID=UPI000D54D526|nr:tetratricopeptide repeat protein [Dysgonomonas sp. Marseille-P4361]
MKKTILLAIFLISMLSLWGQEYKADEISKMYDAGKYEELISKYASSELEYSADMLYYIGLSYMGIEDDENCIKYMDLAIEKDPTLIGPYYTKATSLLFLGKYSEAVPLYEKCIDMDTVSEKLAKSYNGLGAAYYYMKDLDASEVAFKKSVEYDEASLTAYSMLTNIYMDKNENDKALAILYEGKSKVSQDEEGYSSLLFNIALLEQLKGNNDVAKKIYEELLVLDPNDYHAYAKLIQIHYHNKDYDKAKPLKEKLYDAHSRKLLSEQMSDMFCIDQFKFNDKLIQVFERYQSGKSANIYDKLRFYIIDENGEIEYRIQTEYSPAAVSMGSGTYMLCAWKKDSHLNYGLIFNEDSSYGSIKDAVIKILEKEE